MLKNDDPDNADDERQVERRRRALRDSLAAAGMTLPDAARAAGLPRANALHNFLNGRTAALSARTYEALARVVPGATPSSLMGLEGVENTTPVFRPIQLRARAEAGLMRESFDLPADRRRQIAPPVDQEDHAAGVFGVEVGAPGAEDLYPAGSILARLPSGSHDGPLPDGMKVIVQRIVDARVEVTVRELRIEDGHASLVPRGARAEHRVAVPVPHPEGQFLTPWRDKDGRWNVAAVVIGAWINEKR